MSYFEFVSVLIRQTAHIEGMILSALKLVVSAGLVFVSGGVWPFPPYGAVISIGACVIFAVALHFAAP